MKLAEINRERKENNSEAFTTSSVSSSGRKKMLNRLKESRASNSFVVFLTQNDFK